MKVRPLHDQVIVQRVKAEATTKSGLIIPQTAQDKPTEAVVLAVGSGQRLPDGTVRPPEVKAGDHILFGKYTGNEIEINGEKALVLREGDILAVLDP